MNLYAHFSDRIATALDQLQGEGLLPADIDTSVVTVEPPREAAHGDLGLVSKDDCIVAFSTSGKTNEIIEMLELGRHLGLKTIIGITSHPRSRLRELSDITLDMGLIKEPCPLGLTPTATIAVMLAIGDALALTLMELKDITAHDFGLRHHGGYLGRQARTNNQ